MKKAFRRFLLAVPVSLVLFTIVYFAGLRSWHLGWGATEAELAAVMPGDELLPIGSGQATHAITIHAVPEDVWPWIMQIGQDRSGFYSYTWLENSIGCEMPKIEKTVPEWPARTRGETVWFATPRHYQGQGKMIAALVEPNRSVAMVMPGDWRRIQAGGRGQEALWSFTLVPTGPRTTRLIARVRNGPPSTTKERLAGLFFWEPAHFVMERKMLLTIKGLAERNQTISSALR